MCGSDGIRRASAAFLVFTDAGRVGFFGRFVFRGAQLFATPADRLRRDHLDQDASIHDAATAGFCDHYTERGIEHLLPVMHGEFAADCGVGPGTELVNGDQLFVVCLVMFGKTNDLQGNDNYFDYVVRSGSLDIDSRRCAFSGGRPITAASPRTTMGRSIKMGSATMAAIHCASLICLPRYFSL